MTLTHRSPLDTHEALAHFDAIWRGDAQGFSEAKNARTLAEHRRDRAQLERREIPPRRIIGTGYKAGAARGLAFAWLDRQIAECRVAIATSGRNLTVNRRNVAHVLRERSRQEAVA